MKNNISISIAPADLNDINSAISTLQNKLTPYLKALTNEERHQLFKMGDKSIGFVQKAANYGNQFSTQLPAFLDLNEMNKDVEAVTVLNGIIQQLSTLNRAAEDTVMIAGAEAIEASTVVYAAIKLAAHNNVNGAQEAFDDLKERFKGQSKKRGSSTTAAVTKATA